MSYGTIIEALEKASAQEYNSSIKKVLDSLVKIFTQLEERGLDPDTLKDHMSAIKTSVESSPLKYTHISKLKTNLTQTLMKDHGLSTKGYYQNLWLVLGMSLFGIPMGFIFGLALDNFAFFGLGLPMGMPIGIAIGFQKEKKAREAGMLIG